MNKSSSRCSKRLQPKASLRLGMHTPMKKLTGANWRRRELLIMQGRTCWRKWEVHKTYTPTEAGV